MKSDIASDDDFIDDFIERVRVFVLVYGLCVRRRIA